MSIGPNTNANVEILSEKIILCCGEDSAELLTALPDSINLNNCTYHEYRCYKFWKFADFTLIWTGIGTGCLEPLLWEIFIPQIIRKIILIGTAGKLPNSKAKTGKVYFIEKAYSGATALDEDNIPQPLKPRFESLCRLEGASSVSSDFYYGFSEDSLNGRYPANEQKLINALNKHLYKRDLVEMEVAQFYYFCQKFDQTRKLEFLALKGAANTVGKFEEQVAHSALIIKNSLEAALLLLQAKIVNS